MKKIELEKGDVIISKWKREGQDDARGVKLSISDSSNMATVFISLKECEEIIVALFREKEKVKEDITSREGTTEVIEEVKE